jgi:hypothetical protein
MKPGSNLEHDFYGLLEIAIGFAEVPPAVEIDLVLSREGGVGEIA